MIERELLAIHDIAVPGAPGHPASGLAACLIGAMDPSDRLGAGASVVLAPPPGQGEAIESLMAADPIGALCAAPDGTLWAASSAGIIWTTAETGAPPAPDAPPHRGAGPLRWTPLAAPRLAGQNTPPIFTGIWGAGAAGMAAITFDGAVYGWNGAVWSEARRFDRALTAIGGRSTGDFLVGGDGGLLMRHRDRAWTPIELGVRSRIVGIELWDDDLWAVDVQGVVWLIDDDGTAEPAAELETQVSAVCAAQDGIYLCADDGLWRIGAEDAELLVEKNLFSQCFPAPGGGVRLTPWEQGARLSYVEAHFPEDDAPATFAEVELPVDAERG